jgi:hypothetical protein
MEIGNRPALARTLAWTASLGAVTAEALAARERIAVASARDRLARGEREGMLRSWRLLRGRPPLYTLTSGGQRALGLPGAKPLAVSASRTAHMIACCEAAAALELLYPERRLAGEAELLRSRAGLASVEVGGRYAPASHRADLALLAATSSPALPLAVEVELTVKEPRRLLAICVAWARCREVEGVLYVVTPGVRPAIERAVKGARAQRRIEIVGLDVLISVIREPHPKPGVAWGR